MTTDVAPATSTDLVIADDQRNFTTIQIAALESLGIQDASEGDLALFFHQAKKVGLDPFAKQIYLLGRWSKVKSRDDNGRERERYAMRYSIQVGIEGYRLIADRAAAANGDDLEFEGPFWCGDDMEWHDAWPAKTPPTAAKYIVKKNGKPIAAVCHYDEYVQTYRDRDAGADVPNSMWARMPRNQIAKCAEAAALRRAYPNDLSGVHLEDAPTVIDQDGNVERPASRPPRRARGAAGLADAAASAEPAQELVDAEVVDEAAGTSGAAGDDGNWTKDARRKGLNRMHQLFSEGDLPKEAREDRLLVTSRIVGRDIASSNDLTDDEIAQINHSLDQARREGSLGQQITDILNAATLAAEGLAEEGETDSLGDPLNDPADEEITDATPFKGEETWQK